MHVPYRARQLVRADALAALYTAESRIQQIVGTFERFHSPVHGLFQLLPRAQDAARNARNGRWHRRPRVDDSGIADMGERIRKWLSLFIRAPPVSNTHLEHHPRTWENSAAA